MVPSVSALLVLIGSISIGRPIYGIVLTIAFGLGMAFVLVGVGLAFVYARRFVERVPAAAPLRLSQRRPVVTAVVVLLAGVLITARASLRSAESLPPQLAFRPLLRANRSAPGWSRGPTVACDYRPRLTRASCESG